MVALGSIWAEAEQYFSMDNWIAFSDLFPSIGPFSSN
jgi:hypothetical protein